MDRQCEKNSIDKEPSEISKNNLIEFKKSLDDIANDISFKFYKRKLLQILQSTSKNEEIFNMIESEFTKIESKSKIFIRALATAIVRACLDANNRLCKKQNKIRLMNLFPVFTKYITLNEEFELETLLAIQELDQKLRHPGFIGQLLIIIYQGKLISEQVFLNWKSNLCKSYAKATEKQLKKFFETLSTPQLFLNNQSNLNLAKPKPPKVNAFLPLFPLPLVAVGFEKRERRPLAIIDPKIKQMKRERKPLLIVDPTTKLPIQQDSFQKSLNQNQPHDQ